MKIKFLGTSAGWPLPRLGCNCEICSSTDPKDKRSRTQLLINGILLLDIGPETYYHLTTEGVDPRKIKYAAISHEHPDHTSGIWDIGHIYGAEKIKILVHELTYRKISRLFFTKKYEVIKIASNRSLEANGLELSFLPVDHTDSSFGILIADLISNKKVFYAPDFKSLPETTIKQAANVDIAVLDGSELKINIPTHKPITEIIKLNKKMVAKNVYFVHIGHRTLPHKELESFVSKRGGKNFHVAYDNLELEI
jgi:phosphoribosyl 1,2-cyclic phosphate phosphodiesterase